jgi:response regulator RpfG family c-di-GMP phosphodiesterase
MSEFLFSDTDDQPPPAKKTSETPWHILVVDDEPSVHDVTRLTLGRLEVFDQPLKLHSAYSAAEARELLEGTDLNFCMAFIDVVMETQNAGLELVQWIRKDLDDNEIRLVLRTGQAGMAPESDVIRQYDINDYRAKTDLTAQSLSTCVFNAVRGYRDITTISRSLSAFRKLIDTSASLLKEDNLNEMAAAAFKGLLSILNMESSSLYMTRREQVFSETEEKVISCTGRYAKTEEAGFDELPKSVRTIVEQAYETKSTIVSDTEFAGYFSIGKESGSVLYVEFNDDPTHFRASIVEIFATQAVLIFENLSRQIQLENSQKELMYIVGDAIEARSLETGSHVKRVALFCEFFAVQIDQPKEFVSAIKIAAPLHDIGKIAIPETILHKPGKLDADEWTIMQTHAAAGATILEKSNLPVAKLGARLARWHHENWDGSGYPDGLVGEDIPIEARIMAIADVFDALGAKRSYKEPWPNEKILEFILEERGKKFDPNLVDILERTFDELIELRNQFPD